MATYQAHGPRVDLRGEAADDAILLQLLDPAQTWRRRHTDPRRQLDIGDPAVMLQDVENAPVGGRKLAYHHELVPGRIFVIYEEYGHIMTISTKKSVILATNHPGWLR